ncbi:MAG: hypothetical protein R3208_19930, partial [Ketobacteraceae bacterium]|nr:hypothetical protein [Ketobacteraceae bacterium]
MKITRLFNDPATGGGGLSENDSINIKQPADINGRTGYRRILYLRLTLGNHANGIRIHRNTSKLASRFSEYLLHLTSDNDSFQTQGWQVEEDDNLVKVRLTHPWRLNYVKTWDLRGIDVLRMDGDALSAEPTVKANANMTIAAEFTAQDFALRKKPRYNQSQITQAADASISQVAQSKALKDKQIKKMSPSSSGSPSVSIDN